MAHILNHNRRLAGLLGLALALSIGLGACRTAYQTNGSQATLHAIEKNIPDDSSTVGYIQPYKQKMERLMQDTLGFSEQLLDKDRRGGTQSKLGNFMADLLLQHGRNTLDKKIDISLANAGGLRTTLPMGPITLGKVYEVMPFDNTVMVLEVTTAQIDSLVQMAVAGKDVLFGGMRIEVDETGKPQVWVGSTPLQADRTYKLITSDYLATGGSSMSFLRSSKVLNNTGLFIRDFMADYIRAEHKAGRRINPTLDDRFIRKPKP